MKFFLIPAVFLAILFWGCITTPLGVTITSRAPKDSTSSGPVQIKRAWIFVEGSQQGTTPATVRIRRDYEITNVSLHVGQNFDEVRRYEIERSVTSNRIMQDFTFQGSSDSGMLTFNSTELSRDSKGRFIVPYYQYPLQIVDHEYDLVLIVTQ
ncbi:MAG: hypothetical protein OXE92_04630 [Bacteroidetes bacterium]|nr:hypothetical protein [Bacteroidota bacterium]